MSEATATPTLTVAEGGNEDYRVRISNVGKFYARRKQEPFKAIENVTFDMRPGEFVSVVGPSGCGKSTLLRMLAGLDTPSSGFLEIVLEDPNMAPTAVVFQEYSIYPWKTVLDNVAYGLRMRGVSRDDARQEASRWIEKVGLAKFENNYPSTLSGGMKQRVAVARAMALNPEVLLLDEPFAALDAQMRQVLQEELLRQWQDNVGGRCAMLVTHSLEEAILLGDSIVLMSASPGVIKARYEVPFERPRDPQIRTSQEFAELHEQIWEELRTEVAAAAAQRSGK